MMRTTDPTFLNAVANREDVRPLLGGEGPIDLTGLLLDLSNYAFVNEHGGFVLQRIAPGRFEAHSLFEPGSRGVKPVLSLMRAVQEYMFCYTDCVELVTKVPEGHGAAAWLARAGGFVEQFRRSDVGVWHSVSYQVLPLDRWVEACSTLPKVGQVFHVALEEAKRASGSPLPTHPEDAHHDRVVGAAHQMIVAGNAVKGVSYYNRWAVFAGYQPISLLSEQPIVVDVRDALVSVRDGKMEVLQCR